MNDLKYKVGDRVKIKSLDWYNENRGEFGVVNCKEHNFTQSMIPYCGSILTIIDKKEDGYWVNENAFKWTDEMIECKVEEETKPGPKFKVGDRIKWYNHTCNIISIDTNENTYTYLIKHNDYREDKTFAKWVPESELTFEDDEETKPEPKFYIGDIVYSKTWQRNVVIMEILPDGFYKVGEFGTGWFKSHEDNLCKDIVKPTLLDKSKLLDKPTDEYTLPDGYVFKDENGNVINATKIILEKLVVPKFKKGEKIKDKNNRVWYVVQVGNRHFDISSIPNGSGFFVPIEDQDEYELCPDKELPKTLMKCEEVLSLGVDGGRTCTKGYKASLIQNFQKLLIYRDAYWKIYGEETGLGKPWEPDWKSLDPQYVILYQYGSIDKAETHGEGNYILTFPTEEMRDAFYENFKKEIETCKELL